MNCVDPQINVEWKAELGAEFGKEYFASLKGFLLEEKAKYRVYPPGNKIFSAFDLTPFSRVRVVIIGQDPYHGEGQAHGLCFSVNEGIPHPPSLINIFKELQADMGIPYPRSGNLEPWARQGVLLLNATLTVRANSAGSHQNKGWEQFTDEAIRVLSARRPRLIFLLWGRFAQNKEKLIDLTKHKVLKCGHPSPMSANQGLWFGNRHFSRANSMLRDWGEEPLDWTIR